MVEGYLKPEEVTIKINNVDYSTYIENFSVNGGVPEVNFINTWSGRKKYTVNNYEELEITFDMLVGSDTQTFLNGLRSNYTTSYTIIIGSDNKILNTYSNLYLSDIQESMKSTDLQIRTIQFLGEGIPGNIN